MSAQKQERVLDFAEARRVVEREAALVLRLAQQSAPELCQLCAARRRVLAEALTADRDLPPFRRATRDGYAVRAADAAGASAMNPVRLELVGEIAAGAAALPRVSPGQAAAIMTGAPAPEGADAVVMVEYARHSAHDNWVELMRAAQPGENIVARGAEARAGEVLLAAGRRLDAAAIGVAAAVGRAEVKVYPRPRVAVLATGDELVGVGCSPAAHQIRNSNSYALAAQVESAGGEAVVLPLAPDEPARLHALVTEGLEAGLLLLSGGVSMGKHDLVEQALEELGAEFFFTGVRMQPGQPVVFGRAPASSGQQTYFFGLPGNPVSTLTTFDVLARPLVESLAGAESTPLRYLTARLKREIKVKPGLTRFLPGRLAGQRDQTEVELVPWQGSGDLVAAAQADCYVVVGPQREEMAAGEMAAVLMRQPGN